MDASSAVIVHLCAPSVAGDLRVLPASLRFRSIRSTNALATAGPNQRAKPTPTAISSGDKPPALLP